MFAQPCVFVKQLPGPILCASPGGEDPLSRSYGVSLPNSLTMNLSTPEYALPDYLCRFAVRVPHRLSLADFLGSMLTRAIGPPRGAIRTVGLQLMCRICLAQSAPLPFNALFRQRAAVSRLRLHVAPWGSNGMLTVSAIAIALRLRLRTRLTPG